MFPLVVPLIVPRRRWRWLDSSTFECIRYLDIVSFSCFLQLHWKSVLFSSGPFCLQNILSVNILIFPKCISMNNVVFCSENARFRHVFSSDQEGSTGVFESQEMPGVVTIRVFLPDRYIISSFWNRVDSFHRNWKEFTDGQLWIESYLQIGDLFCEHFDRQKYNHWFVHRRSRTRCSTSFVLRCRIHNFHIFQKYRIYADHHMSKAFHEKRVDLSGALDDCRLDRRACTGRWKVIQLGEDWDLWLDTQQRDCPVLAGKDDRCGRLSFPSFLLRKVCLVHVVYKNWNQGRELSSKPTLDYCTLFCDSVLHIRKSFL